jgi:hypothetical protein
LFVTVIGGNRFRRFDAGVEASGPHDFAVRLKRSSSRSAKASTASPAQRFVTIAKRPSCGQETRGKVLVICPTAQAKMAAAHWHDGQITFRNCRALAHVKGMTTVKRDPLACNHDGPARSELQICRCSIPARDYNALQGCEVLCSPAAADGNSCDYHPADHLRRWRRLSLGVVVQLS